MERLIDIPQTWHDAARLIVTRRWRSVLVLGANDRGKSTFCRFIIGELTNAGLTTAFVDADVGQKDIGPPATVSLAHVSESGFDNADLLDLYFVGDVNPMRHFLPLVVGTKRMVESARADCVVIDTTGLIHGPGRPLKGAQIDLLRPDVIVALQRGRELEAVLGDYRNRRILRASVSPQARSKSPQARKAARERAFARYLHGAGRIVIDVADIEVRGAPLFYGIRIHDPRFVYAEKTTRGIVAVSAQLKMTNNGPITVLPLGFEKNLLCGVEGDNGCGLGIGIIAHIDYRGPRLHVFTHVRPDRVRAIQFGNLYVGEDGREFGRRLR